MENQQPAGEAQNDQKKEWYKNWWGVIIAIMILPIFAIWYIWAKTEWNNKAKWITTVLVIILSISAIGSTEQSDNKTASQPQQTISTPAPVQETKKETPAPQLPKFVFDIPSLIGKNIDEVTQALGKPSGTSEPTKQQQAMGIDEGNKNFSKDGNDLLVTYKVKSKMIVDFFIDGTDKNKLLIVGNLQENNNNYTAEFVKSITNANEITGVKVSVKLPEELNANVTYSSNAFKIENKEDYDWSGCKFEINGGGKIFSGGYEYKSSTGIKAKDNIVIPFSEFTKDSQRFNFYSEKPENLFISCNTNGQSRTNYFTIK